MLNKGKSEQENSLALFISAPSPNNHFPLSAFTKTTDQVELPLPNVMRERHPHNLAGLSHISTSQGMPITLHGIILQGAAPLIFGMARRIPMIVKGARLPSAYAGRVRQK